MSDFYEEWATETVTLLNTLHPAEREPYEEAASELLSLARACREAGA